MFISPEDVILNKLLFYKEGGVDKHARDIAGVLRISGDSLDVNYLNTWAKQLGVEDELAAIRRAETRAD
jgi:hypothetical protein